MTEPKPKDLHDTDLVLAPHAQLNEKVDRTQADHTKLERRRKAFTSCQIAVLALEEGIRTLLKDAMDQVKKITGQVSLVCPKGM